MALLKRLDIRQPAGGVATNEQEALAIANKVGSRGALGAGATAPLPCEAAAGRERLPPTRLACAQHQLACAWHGVMWPYVCAHDRYLPNTCAAPPPPHPLPQLGYPVMVRPSYVLGGRAMEIVYSDADIHRYINTAVEVRGAGGLWLGI